MAHKAIQKLNRLLAIEEEFAKEMNETVAAKQLQDARGGLLGNIRDAGRSGDLSLIIATERAIVEGDLSRYANSQSMTNSLKTAVNEIAAIERHIGIVDAEATYRTVDHAHSLPRNRKGGLPLDEARQALASHFTRLNNMDKSRLGGDEKKIIDARKVSILVAGKLYAARQAKTLGVDPSRGKKRGPRL
ncbi:MAG: hypothetical protein Q8L45_11360 [Xanthomonadaceae bacterium]|nr:hypothetical protein [Xanthomonadaceae bacterium]MDP2184465.1 hypothetical protein [Xanthomonadales bacterium]MDZ4115760.1 hypothetical protein [Xanthomonadaceae bacterium]